MAAKQKGSCQFLQNCQGWLSSLNPFSEKGRQLSTRNYILLTESKN